MNFHTTILVSSALLSAVGCISVKTESEIKPIHITMDVNLKIDKEIDKAFADEDVNKPNGSFKAVRDLLNRKVAGITNRALLEARTGATDEDRILIAESNARKLKRFNEIARSSGVTLETIQKRSAKKFAGKVTAGSGIWIQAEDGEWRQR